MRHISWFVRDILCHIFLLFLYFTLVFVVKGLLNHTVSCTKSVLLISEHSSHIKNCVKYINYSAVTEKFGKFSFSYFYFVNGSLLHFYLQLLRFYYFVATVLILNSKHFGDFYILHNCFDLKFLNSWSSNDLHPLLFHLNTSSFNFAQSEWVENSTGHFLWRRSCTRIESQLGFQLTSCHMTLHGRHRKLTSVWSNAVCHVYLICTDSKRMFEWI